MNSLILSARQEDPSIVSCSPPAVYINGTRRRDLYVKSWEVLPAPDFGKAILVLADQFADSPARFGNLTALPPVGAKVRILPDSNPDGAQFRGVVSEHTFTVDQEGERLAVVCQHLLSEALGQKVSGVWQLAGEQPVEVNPARVCFNTGRNSMATASTVSLNGRTCRLFDSSLTARSWTVADALGYLIAATVPRDTEAPAIGQLESLAGNIDLGALDVTGRPAGEALAEVLRRGGLGMRSGRDSRSLIVYRRGTHGRRRNVRLQRAGAALDTAKTNLFSGQLSTKRRPSRPSVLAMGQAKQYESTFELSKGWDPSLQAARWRDFVPSKSDNWPKLACVYRKWVLNEHGWYSGQPWNLQVYDFSGISSADFKSQRTRRFLPCLSTDSQGQSLGAVVEFRLAPGATWRRWPGPVWVSRDQCAVYLGGDGLPGEFFQAAVNDQASLRITCVVEADEHLSAEVTGDPNVPREVADLSDRAAWRSVHATSIFADAEGVGAPAERDDTALLTNAAQRRAEIASVATEATLQLGWVDTTYQVGDLVERVEGREFELSSNPDTRPHVKAVRHDFGTKQTTQILVSG